MLELLRSNWWIVALRGVASVLFGMLALLWPGVTLAALIVLYGAYAIVDGAFAIGAAVQRRRIGARTAAFWVEGLLGIAAGVLAWLWPGLTAIALVYVIAAWAVVTGVLEISAAIRLRKEIEGEWLLAAAGLASVVFGVVLALNPLVGTLALLWLLGWYAIAFGLFLVGLAVSVRIRRDRGQPSLPAHA